MAEQVQHSAHNFLPNLQHVIGWRRPLHSISCHDCTVFAQVTKSALIQFYTLCSQQGHSQGPSYLCTEMGSIMKLHATVISEQIASSPSPFFPPFSFFVSSEEL